MNDDIYNALAERNLNLAEKEVEIHGNKRFEGKEKWVLKMMLGIREKDDKYDDRIEKLIKGE